MNWIHLTSWFFGGLFFGNAIPHFVAGMMGRAFQTPFAKPPGKGLSSSVVNVVWGFANFVVAYVLVCRVGEFELRSTIDFAVFGAGVLLIGVGSAYNFGKLHGGRLSK